MSVVDACNMRQLQPQVSALVFSFWLQMAKKSDDKREKKDKKEKKEKKRDKE